MTKDTITNYVSTFIGNASPAEFYVNTLKELGYDFREVTEEMAMSAPAGLNVSSGTAYDGALANHCILTYMLACKIARLISSTLPIDSESIKKVCFLQQISKAQMMIPNDNTWEIEKRGMAYKFNSLVGCLQAGARSTLIASNSGIKFTPEEYEAMQILDKDGDELKKLRFVMTPLTMVVEQANTLAYALEKEKCEEK